MNAILSVMSDFGGDLTASDYSKLEARWITPCDAHAAGLRRVDSLTGQQMFARKRGDLAGMIIPNCWPGEGRVREYRLRLDNPELEYRIDGSIREARKYIQPPQRGNILYIPPGIPPEILTDTSVIAVIAEGEFKALSLERLGHQGGVCFLPIAIAGVWNWRGTVGKVNGANGDRRDVKGVISDFERITWKGRRVIIAFDADVESNPKVRIARGALAAALIERGAIVGFLEWPAEEGKGIDDRLATVGPERVIADIAAVDFGGWSTRLLRNEAGKIMACYENVSLFFENSPDWAGVLGFNEFTAGYSILKQPPSPVTAAVGSEIEDHFDTEVTRWVERHRLMVKPELVRRVVDAVARRNPFHPVREFLEGLPQWDGKERKWLSQYCGAASSVYTEQVGGKFLVSAVARIFEPGCKADHLLILEGPQGIGKSTAARILAGDDWFSDQLADMGSKDASMQVRGVWMIELSELDALNRVEMARAKGFLSLQTERFRLPYGRRLVQVPRQCVFIGTTNSDSWLKDETGGRRFWPVRCRRIDLVGLKHDREQLWAEALHQYRAGERWWLEDEETVRTATEEQRGRFQEDPWYPKVVEYVEGVVEPRNGVAISEILARLGVETAKQDQAAANRVARCLKAAGWEKFRKRTATGFPWLYRKTEI
jgi:predicted P-loop ATPase